MAATAQTFENRIFTATDAVIVYTVEKDGKSHTYATYDYTKKMMRMLIDSELKLMGANALGPWGRVVGVEWLEVEYTGKFYRITLMLKSKEIVVSY